MSTNAFIFCITLHHVFGALHATTYLPSHTEQTQTWTTPLIYEDDTTAEYITNSPTPALIDSSSQTEQTQTKTTHAPPLTSVPTTASGTTLTETTPTSSVDVTLTTGGICDCPELDESQDAAVWFWLSICLGLLFVLSTVGFAYTFHQLRNLKKNCASPKVASYPEGTNIPPFFILDSKTRYPNTPEQSPYPSQSSERYSVDSFDEPEYTNNIAAYIAALPGSVPVQNTPSETSSSSDLQNDGLPNSADSSSPHQGEKPDEPDTCLQLNKGVSNEHVVDDQSCSSREHVDEFEDEPLYVNKRTTMYP